MLAVVKAPHIEIRGETIPAEFLTIVKRFFNTPVEVVEDDDEAVDWFETDLHKEIVANRSPGLTMRAFRMRDQLTQQELADKLGVSRQTVCDMEKNRRPISAKTAKMLSEIFKTKLDTWL